jgi:hypothetical protein
MKSGLDGRGVSRMYLECGMVVIQSSELVDLFKSYDMRTRQCRVYAPHSACSVRFTGFTLDTRQATQKLALSVIMLCI